MNEDKRKRTVIYSVPALEAVREVGFRLQRALRMITQSSVRQFRHYPDGSCQLGPESSVIASFENSGYCDAVYDASRTSATIGKTWLGTSQWQPLSPLSSECETLIRLFGRFVLDWPDGALSIWTRVLANREEEERLPCPKTAIPVTVTFRRRLTKEIREEFVQLIGRWAASVRENGIFEEGPVSVVDNRIEFWNRRAQFVLDASQSGQNTINWLILCLLSFSYVNTVIELFFVAKELVDDCSDFPAKGKVVVCDVPVLPASDGSDCCLWHLGDPEFEELRKLWEESRNPRPADKRSPYEALVQEWESLRQSLEEAPFDFVEDDDWSVDCLGITILLEDGFVSGRKETQCLQSLHMWLKIGMDGGFSSGFDHVEGPRYDEATRGVKLWCDMGTADPIQSFHALVTVLQGWMQLEVAIRSVRFEKAGADFVSRE